MPATHSGSRGVINSTGSFDTSSRTRSVNGRARRVDRRDAYAKDVIERRANRVDRRIVRHTNGEARRAGETLRLFKAVRTEGVRKWNQPPAGTFHRSALACGTPISPPPCVARIHLCVLLTIRSTRDRPKSGPSNGTRPSACVTSTPNSAGNGGGQARSPAGARDETR